MELFDKDLGSSIYLFDEAYRNYKGSCVFFAVFVLIAALALYLAIKHYPETSWWRKLIGPAIIIGVGVANIMTHYQNFQTMDAIYRHHDVTQGTTLKRENRSKQSFIVYRYRVKDMLYTTAYPEPYVHKSLPSIIIPNGHYKVIYNKLHPDISVIDFMWNMDDDK
ncbi:hypothetical protein C8P68_107198 [Mucilaginibacter yixingensis]|uniref:Uncharacterized protein n=1 Tax=Mucilaginibacter yixingensis TaxID=1295612 RepID=A0A2T5J6H2_9SPHI|nr:hypothetical protein [Mucilaginibacter yixingensis]PTQ94133.1 hypothetical protein C8P68_107198 [Mucilaginibacter yixingensis]